MPCRAKGQRIELLGTKTGMRPRGTRSITATIADPRKVGQRSVPESPPESTRIGSSNRPKTLRRRGIMPMHPHDVALGLVRNWGGPRCGRPDRRRARSSEHLGRITEDVSRLAQDEVWSSAPLIRGGRAPTTGTSGSARRLSGGGELTLA